MNEKFDLAQWELAPDSPETLEGVASGRVRANWLGKESEFLLREVEIAPKQFAVFAREVDSEEEGNWVLYPKSKTWKGMVFDWVGTSLPSTRAPNPMNLFSRVDHVELGRVFHLSLAPFGTPELGFVFVNTAGETFLRVVPATGHNSHRDDLYFRVEINDIQHANPREWNNRIKQEIGNPASSARFALEWRVRPFEENCERALQFENGSYTEMKRVFIWALRSLNITVSTEKSLDWNFVWEHNTMGQSLYLLTADGDEHEHEPDEFLCNWREVLLSWFNPTFNEELIEKHWCVRSWCADNNLVFAVRTEVPTHHERLEAALELRDWARGKVPDELLRTLL